MLDQKKSGRFPHASLFVGPKHIGKSLFTRLLAQFLQGTTQDHSHPDITIIDEVASGEDEKNHTTLSLEARKTDSISINDTKLIQEKLQRTTNSLYNIAIINDIERMGNEASNALLKIIEEPPSPQTLFFFTTSSLNSIPKTILSRCEVVEMHCPNWHEIETWLKKNNFELSSIQEILPFIPKKPGTLINMLETEEFRINLEEKISALNTNLNSKSPLSFFRYAEKIASRSDAETTLDLLTHSCQYHFNQLSNKEQVAPILLHIQTAVKKSFKQLSQNVTPKLVMECLALEVQPLFKSLFIDHSQLAIRN